MNHLNAAAALYYLNAWNRLLLERFSYDLEMKLREQNRNRVKTNGNRVI